MDYRVIAVEDYQKKDGITKHSLFKIVGQVRDQGVSVMRRYRDFTYLRKILSLNWPACFIPQIPPKQIIGNNDDEVLERRKKLLSRFLLKIADKDYLFHTEEFQKFIFYPGEFHKVDFVAENYIQVGEKYHKIFNEFINTEVSDEMLNSTHSFLNFCSISLHAFEKFEKSCKNALESLSVYRNSNDIMINSLKNLGNRLPKVTDIEELHIPSREAMTNPFELLLFWVVGEILDTKAMIEAIQKLLSLPERNSEYSKKLEKKKKSLENLKQGKLDLKSIFSNKSTDHQKQSSKKTIEFYELEVSGIETIYKTCIGKLISYDLPEHKSQKIESLCTSVGLFADLMQTELGKVKYQSSFIRIKL